MKRDIGQEILDGIEAIKEGRGKETKVELPSDVSRIRGKRSPAPHLHALRASDIGGL